MHPFKNIEVGESGYFIHKFENIDPGEPNKQKWVRLMRESIVEKGNEYNKHKNNTDLNDLILQLEAKKVVIEDKRDNKKIKSKLLLGGDGKGITRK